MALVIVSWRVEQKLTKSQNYDDKDSEQLSSFISQGKNTMPWWILSKYIFCWLTVALLNAGNTTCVLVSFFQIHLIPV